jgi:hypothetical protein
VQKQWARIRRRAGLDDLRLHDLRHNLASTAVADGHSLYVVGRVLGHRKARSTERYAHLADDPTRMVADRAASSIAAALDGNAPDAARRLARLQGATGGQPGTGNVATEEEGGGVS